LINKVAEAFGVELSNGITDDVPKIEDVMLAS
jgi:hypothetical protein